MDECRGRLPRICRITLHSSGHDVIIFRLCPSRLIFGDMGCALFLIPGVISAFQAFKRGELLKGQTSISTIRNLSWHGLEELVGEAYRQQGYSVTGNSGWGADGGVDILARKDGETILVQCKQWKARRLG